MVTGLIHIAVATVLLLVFVWIVRRVGLWMLGLMAQPTFCPRGLPPD
jgi:hypothetical protein